MDGLKIFLLWLTKLDADSKWHLENAFDTIKELSRIVIDERCIVLCYTGQVKFPLIAIRQSWVLHKKKKTLLV